jgi:hypothetical protein
MMILVKKASISSKTNIICLLCPPPGGHFSIQESAAGGLSYNVKKSTLAVTPMWIWDVFNYVYNKWLTTVNLLEFITEIVLIKTIHRNRGMRLGLAAQALILITLLKFLPQCFKEYSILKTNH